MNIIKLYKNQNFEFYTASNESGVKIPLMDANVHAGFPSPATDYVEKAIDISEELVKHPAATFYIKVKGESMVEANVKEDDILVVDRSLTPKNGDIVLAIIDGDFTVKHFKQTGEDIFLVPANKKYKQIQITEMMDFEVWGVVTYIIHKAV